MEELLEVMRNDPQNRFIGHYLEDRWNELKRGVLKDLNYKAIVSYLICLNNVQAFGDIKTTFSLTEKALHDAGQVFITGVLI